MHHTVKYDHHDPRVNYMNALRDIEDFIGAERYAKLTDMFAETNYDHEALITAMSFAGIQGYPATAWAQRVSVVRMSKGHVL